MKSLNIILILILYTNECYGQVISIKDTVYIQVCDTSHRGIMPFDLEKIKKNIFSESDQEINPTVFLCTAGGGILKITDILTNPKVEIVCNLSQTYTDIAINKDKEIYTCSYNSIFKLNSSNCTTTNFYTDEDFLLVALSFDTKNNLYTSNGPEVLRFNNTTGNPVLWKDFGTGQASGDFVMKKDKMYISWDVGGGVDLLEVTVDQNINYVSHKKKCRIKSNTYGLASELGQLYGVTPSELYKIDEENCTYTTVIQNRTGNSWYGAAGMHEAGSSVSAHAAYSDAASISNAISGFWYNTIPYSQLIYVSVHNQEKDSIYIYPIRLKITPAISVVESKKICKGENYRGYTQSGRYQSKHKTSLGCDSTHSLILEVNDFVNQNFTKTICEGDNFRGYQASGHYIDRYKTSTGCDSTINIYLTVLPRKILTIQKTICRGKTFLGKSVGGIYSDTFRSAEGCDSIRQLTLTVIDIPKPVVHRDACIISNQKIRFFSQIITQPGTYIDSTNHREECDTIFVLNVVLQTPKHDTIHSTQCYGFQFKGIPIYNDTILNDTIRSALGCDSIYRLLPTQIQKLMPAQNKIKYFCDTFYFQNQLYSSDTALRDTLRYSTFPFCDSIRREFHFRSAPKPSPKIATTGGQYLIKGESMKLTGYGASRFLWNTNETNRSIEIKPYESTYYILKGWNEYECYDTLGIWIEVEDLVYFDLPTAFTPNSDGINDVWTPNASGSYKIIYLDIFNRWGEKVFSGNDTLRAWDGLYKNQAQPSGVYMYSLMIEKNRRLYERKGSFTLIR